MPEILRTVIVDDEPLARKGILKLLSGDDRFTAIAECGDGPEAVDAITRLAPDLVFLDIQMPGMDGFGVIEKLDPEKLPMIVFVTAYDSYAIKAFEVNAIDYLLKPFSNERFRETLERVSQRFESSGKTGLKETFKSLIDSYLQMGGTIPQPEPTGTTPDKYLPRLMIKDSGKVFFVSVSEILWIESVDYYSRVHIKNNSYLLRESLRNFERSLDPKKFFRIHRSSIVNIDTVESIERNSSGDYTVFLDNGQELKMSRTRKEIMDHFKIS